MWPLLVALILGQNPQPSPAAVQRPQSTIAECDAKGTLLQTIRTVNLLVSMGPENSKQALNAYFQTTQSKGKTGLYAVLNCMYEVPNPPGYLPPPLITARAVGVAGLKKSPRYPFELAGDIPFLNWPLSTGEWETEAEYFARLQTAAQMRTTPLVPVDQPWGLLRTGDYAGNFPFEPLRVQVNRNILELVSSACQPGDEVETPIGWRSMVAQLKRVNMHWDRVRQLYVLPDGSTLPPPVPRDPNAPITWTDPLIQPANATVTIQRRNATDVDFSCSYLGQRGTGFRSLYIRILVGGVAAREPASLVEFDRKKRKPFVRGASPMEIAKTSLAVPVGTKIVIEVMLDGRTVRSFPITP